MQPQSAADTTIHLTDSTMARIAEVQASKNNPAIMLRLTVLGGGCSGFQYALDFTDVKNEDDVTFGADGKLLVTDAGSLPFLDGATVDFERTMVKSAFKIKNPNAASGCGCGKSFGV